MPSPLEFLRRYRLLRVTVGVEDPVARVSRTTQFTVQLKKYFMMDWEAGSDERADYDVVTAGGAHNAWYQLNRDGIRSAAMGKGSPQDYERAMEWAVRSGQLRPPVTERSLQAYADDHLGIDCSGFVTNYLIACGKKADTTSVKRNTGAASYYEVGHAVNDAAAVQQGDLLVWMDGTQVKRSPGHVAVVESYEPSSRAGGNMRVVEATGAREATPKLLDSMYEVTQITPRGNGVPVMILTVTRHRVPGSRVAVMRY